MLKRAAALTTMLLFAAAAGCASKASDIGDGGYVPKCVEPIVPGISQGVAGVATYVSDVGGHPDKPAASWMVTVGGINVTTDSNGQFAVALEPGDYLTGNADANVMVHVDAGSVVRADLSVNVGFVSWWLPAICAH